MKHRVDLRIAQERLLAALVSAFGLIALVPALLRIGNGSLEETFDFVPAYGQLRAEAENSATSHTGRSASTVQWSCADRILPSPLSDFAPDDLTSVRLAPLRPVFLRRLKDIRFGTLQRLAGSSPQCFLRFRFITVEPQMCGR